MNMQKTHKVKFNHFITGAVAVILVEVIVFGGLLVWHNVRADAATAAQKKADAATPSQFTFHGSKGWWQGATSKTDIAIFPDQKNCFVSVQHITGSLSDKQNTDQAAIIKLVAQGYKVTQLGSQSLSITTGADAESYQLQQIDVQGSGDANKLEGGQEYAYVPLSDKDFLYIEGDCDTSSELQTTLPVLQAISFDANKVK